MSTDEQDALLGSALRLRKEAVEELAKVESLIDRVALTVAQLHNAMQTRVFKPDTPYHYTTKEELTDLFARRATLKEQIQETEKCLVGYLP